MDIVEEFITGFDWHTLIKTGLRVVAILFFAWLATQVLKKILALVEDLDMLDSVLISSYNQDYLAKLREAHPHIATGVLVSKPHPHPEKLLRRLGAQAYHPRLSGFRPTDIALLHSQDYRVHIWNVNDRKTMERLVRAGVDGIFTDFPQLLTSVLASPDIS